MGAHLGRTYEVKDEEPKQEIPQHQRELQQSSRNNHKPDTEWLKGTYAYEFHESQLSRISENMTPKKKKQRSRPKRRNSDSRLDYSFDSLIDNEDHSILKTIADEKRQNGSIDDSTKFNLSTRKDRSREQRLHKMHHEVESSQHRQQIHKEKHSDVRFRLQKATDVTDSTALLEDDFDSLSSEMSEENDMDSETDEEFSAKKNSSGSQHETESKKKNYYEESRKFYQNKHRDRNNDENLLTNGLDLSKRFINSSRKKQPQIYEEMLSANESLQLCKNFPQKYKHCKIKIFNPHRALCSSLDEDIEIEISGRSKCGKAFNQDEVVVEILKNREKQADCSIQSATFSKENENKSFGKIVGITKRNETLPKNPVFVCTIDQYVMHLMKPVCKTVPKIHVLNERQKTKFQVEIYKYDKRAKDLKFDRLKTIHRSKRKGYTFLVCFIAWNEIYPKGAIIGVYDFRCDLNTSLKLVCLQSNVSVIYKESTVREVEKILKRKAHLNGDEHRTDFSESLNAFTIDESDSKDLDDALSVQTISETEFEIGVHIADVGSVVKRDDPVDVEALERSNTFYPGENCQPFHMLPEPLGTDICSLLPHQERKTLSIFFRIDKDGNILEQRLDRTKIKSRRRFTYLEVQKLLSKANKNENFKQELEILSAFTKQIRSKRLGNGMFSFPFESPDTECSKSYFQSIDAHIIVEECMILANQFIGKILIEAFPDCIPLRVQSKPSSHRMNEWLLNFSVIANFVLSLQHKCLENGKILSVDKIHEHQMSQQLPIQKHVWNKIVSSYSKGDFKNLQRFIGTDEFHPQQASAYDSWMSFQETSRYECSGSPHEKIHFSLGIYPYVHFTSPIRRYADLIANRLVHALLDNKVSPYSQREVEMICKNVNRSRPREFERKCRLLHLGRQLERQPVILHTLVKSASEKSVSICFPGQSELANSCGEINYHLMKLKSKPLLEEDCDKKHLLTLSWQQRLYSTLGFSAGASNSIGGPVCLNPHQKVTYVSLKKWKKLVDSLIRDDMNLLNKKIFEGNEDLPSVFECQGTHSDASSETKDGVIGKQYTEFKLTFSKAQVIPIQIGVERSKGMLMPSIQLLEITRNLKCCIQHMSDPVQCFSSYAKMHEGNRKMTSPEYVSRWLNIFRMESVTNATKSLSIVINDLHVKFYTGKKYDGSFVLLKHFCLQRDIDFRWHVENNSENTVSDQTDFLCIRCELVKGVPSRPSIACSPEERRIWIGHGETKFCQKGRENGDVKVHFKLHRDSPKPSLSMIDSGNPTCAVEILQMSEADKNIEDAVKGLESGKELAKSIALRGEIHSLDDVHVRLGKQIRPDVIHDSLQPNNEKQLEAIKKALCSRFTLIQGPPGTGKTLTGIKLILLFMNINLTHRENGGDHNQVVYCGPSNKSVDLVARWIRTYIRDLCPKMVRMYGSSIESTVFPVPGRDYINQSSCKDNRPDSDLVEVSLHNLIRKKDKPFAEKIKQFDKLFKENPNGIYFDPELVNEYRKVLSDATQEELKHYDVIFCTTAVATNQKFLKATEGKIYQLIIDEAGMCTEPETMAPIIATKAEQVVLIGDHKQLQPIIICQEAAELGLSKSLFERFADNAVFLDTQYRMNEKICEFPSKQFYKGKLKTGPSKKYEVKEPLKIWRNPHTPLLFCHMEGEEECLAVSTEEGNQQSRSNKAEVEHVVRVYEFLMSHKGIQTQHVKVMSQYNAQCFAIREALLKKGFINSKVHTVVSSQGGEWDYVIFSTVRSLPDYRIEPNPSLGWRKRNLGFITDEHQINVALTRARKGIIIIGNKKLLQCDLVWRELIRHYITLDCVVDGDSQKLTLLKRQGKKR
ncbi:helicase with zinc finger domain 2-like [Saccostrea echinata]|uniref:helicase with zinc finger domain 2-like n=1 Tax=Saccostrea echinata TaxID=191078 RepID=UPI002A83B88A|nr:helicase with zinc finger domain 2-like [Saccostrea echinata]